MAWVVSLRRYEGRVSGVSDSVVHLFRREVGIYRSITRCGVHAKGGILSPRERERGLRILENGTRKRFGRLNTRRLFRRVVTVDHGERCRLLARRKVRSSRGLRVMSTLPLGSMEIIFRNIRNTCDCTTVERCFRSSVRDFRMGA